MQTATPMMSRHILSSSDSPGWEWSLSARAGFGRVFLGHDPDTGRRVAVKVPRRALTTREGESFLNEARSAGHRFALSSNRNCSCLLPSLGKAHSQLPGVRGRVRKA